MPATFHLEHVGSKDRKNFTEMEAGESEGFEFLLMPIWKPAGFTALTNPKSGM
jgi:hypothetical protein